MQQFSSKNFNKSKAYYLYFIVFPVCMHNTAFTLFFLFKITNLYSFKLNRNCLRPKTITNKLRQEFTRNIHQTTKLINNKTYDFNNL